MQKSLATNTTSPRRIFLAVIGVATLVFGAYMVPSKFTVRYSMPEKATWWIAPSMLATKWGYFRQERVNLEDSYWPTGRRALRALMDQQSDIAYAAAPPITTLAYHNEPVLVLAQTMSSRSIVHLLPNAKHVDDWYHYPIGLARGTISEFYLIAHLIKIGKLDLYKKGEITLVDRPNVEANFITLMQNTTQSIVLFEPFASVVTMGGGENHMFTERTDPTVYKVNCFIVTTPLMWESNREAILRTLAAIRRSSNEIMADPPKAWDDVRPMLAYGENAEVWGNRDWKNVDFNLITDKDTIRKNLMQDIEIGMQGGLYKNIPNLDPVLSVIDEVDAYMRERGL
ncbi:MAG TPA: hypothetical protein P5114_11595 [Hyphomicrobiaceae bacterium]|nr:hypothetical protein [Hyphomicrobiaceae bacterium]